MGAWHSQSYREALGNTMRGGTGSQHGHRSFFVLQLHATATQTEPAQKVRDLNRNVVVAPESEFCGRPLPVCRCRRRVQALLCLCPPTVACACNPQQPQLQSYHPHHLL